MQYLKQDLGFEIDPHAHETTYSYADVAYLIEQLGVEPSHLPGGLLADPPEKSKLEYLWEPIQGRQYPSSIWQADFLWGGGTGNHVNETYVDEFRQQIEDLADETSAGKIKWVGFSEVYDIWLHEYNAEPNQLFYTDVHSDDSSMKTESSQENCGDGTCQLIERRLGVCPEDCG